MNSNILAFIPTENLNFTHKCVDKIDNLIRVLLVLISLCVHLYVHVLIVFLTFLAILAAIEFKICMWTFLANNTTKRSHPFSHFHFLLQNQWTNLNPIWYESSLGKVIQVYSNEKSYPLQREIIKKRKNRLGLFKKFLMKSHKPKKVDI